MRHFIVLGVLFIFGMNSAEAQIRKKPILKNNTAPIVNAGADIVVEDSDKNGSQVVNISGTATDKENNIVTYQVYLNGTFQKAGSDISTFRFGYTLNVGTHVFLLKATDSKGLVGQDSVTVTVKAPVVVNTAPKVNAGPDIVQVDADNNGTESVKLAGSSTDAEGNITGYTVFRNGVAVLSGSYFTTLSLSINVPVGTHTIVMEARDAGGLKGSDTMIITVNPPAVVNTAPVVNAGADIVRTDSDNNGTEMISFAGSATDAQNNIVSYRVLLNGVQTATSLSGSINVPVGSHTLVMEATDAGGLKGSDSLTITVNKGVVTPPPTGGTPPVANAGADITVTNNDAVKDPGESTGVERLIVSGSATQGSNPIVSYVWKVNGATVAKSNQASILLNQKFFFIKGSNLLTLEVTDSAGLKSSDNAIIEVKPGLNDIGYLGQGVIANVLAVSAGGMKIVIDRDGNGSEPVRMVGSVTSKNPIVNYKWVWRGQSLAEGSTPDVLTKTLNINLGVNSLKLVVTDSMGNVAEDKMSVDVSAAYTEQVASIPSDPALLTNHLVTEWDTGTNHWKDESAFRFRCKPSHLLFDDPIVFPKQPGKAHLHMFFGNTLANGNSDYVSLRTTGDGTCDGGPLNRSAYWMPAMMNENGKVVVPDHVTIYYKKHPGTHRIPRGLKMIFGYDHRFPQNKFNFWKCSTGGGQFQTLAEVNCPASVNGNNAIMVSLGAQSCWDGKNLDSPDHRSHMASCSQNGYGECTCPTTHPVNIPQFTMLVSWSHTGFAEYSKWRLSSDHTSPHDPTSAPLPGGTSFHADWFGGWDDDVMNMWHEGCMDQFKNCSGGALGMGKQLKENPGFSFTVDPTKRIVDPPVKPVVP